VRFEFSTANRIIFGAGTCAEVPSLARALGQKAFIFTDSPERVSPLILKLLGQGISTDTFQVRNEPDINLVIMAMRMLIESHCDFAIGFGGGSALDTGKAAVVLAANPGDPLAYLEVIGQGRTLEVPPIPYIAIPTTAGTGSEVTRNAVIAFPVERIKVSLRSPFILPRFAIVDPELTYTLPPTLTASTGFDALTQVIEPFVSNTPTPLTDTLCRDGIFRAGRSLLKVYQDGTNAAAREDMSLVSLYGGLSLANARLGGVHGFAGPLGGRYPVPHGSICAILLPLVMEANLSALRSRQPDSPVLDRFREVAQLLTGVSASFAEDAIACLFDLRNKMAIRTLSSYGLKQEDFPLLIGQAQQSSSMKGNPIRLTDKELMEILEKAA
jgi:alcohol dehydrogenase class IV